MNSKKITIFLVEGLPRGVRELKIDQWSGRGVCVPRNRLSVFLQNQDYADLQDKACVYFLVGESDEGGLYKIYVGEADGFKSRIRQQEIGKEWWKDVAVFMSKDDSLTKTGAKYLESVCIERLRDAGRCVLDNNTQPRLPSIPREDISGLEFFYENMSLIMPLMGFDIFIPSETSTRDDVSKLLFCKGKGISASGVLLDDGKLRVKKGSEAAVEDAQSFKGHVYHVLREELVKMGRLRHEKNRLVFVEDYVFDSPSAAAAIVLARSASGPIEWRRNDGRTLKEILETE